MDDLEPLTAGVDELLPGHALEPSLSVFLPSGYVVWPDPSFPQHRAVEGPAFWMSDGPVAPGLWARFREAHPDTGLWPVLLDDSAQPWSAGQIAPERVGEIDEYDPAAFVAEVWSEWAEPPIDVEPFGRYSPGLAQPGKALEDPVEAAERCAEQLAGRPLGLVPAGRGADVLAAIGWQGARHHNPLTAPLSAVVRGWEDRFGARVVGLGFDTLDLSVAAPPVTFRHALRVAAEHAAFCPEVIVQGPGTLAGHAEQLRDARIWSFRWE
jgi:Domain of unknown function (DUF4253)